MMRQLGMGLVLVSSTALGFGVSAGLAARGRSLRELERMAALLQGEIECAATPLGEAFLEVADRLRPPFDRFLAGAAAQIRLRDGRTLSKIFMDCAGETLSESGLTGEDIERLGRLGGRLGYLDREMQLKLLHRYAAELAGEREQAEEEYRRQAKVYRCLGVMGGLFFAVLLW